MEADFWLARWQNNELGFQLEAAHPLLTQCLDAVIGKSTSVFVPLCGKSPDMVFLSQHLSVLGAELSEIACCDFFSEHKLAYKLTEQGQFKRFDGELVSLLQGDFFTLKPEQVAHCQLVYDRAALIALPLAMRQQYSAKLSAIFPAGVRVLLISLEYPQHEKQGPPFAVCYDELLTLFPNARIELLAEMDLTGRGFARRRFETSSLIEKAYCITLG
ncbi:MAG TPA: thiopurine S-methyltransferase [Rheinheimera sp.]|nr:thiopurine S-methyltransferase [Rheinheimera sp.]